MDNTTVNLLKRVRTYIVSHKQRLERHPQQDDERRAEIAQAQRDLSDLQHLILRSMHCLMCSAGNHERCEGGQCPCSCKLRRASSALAYDTGRPILPSVMPSDANDRVVEPTRLPWEDEQQPNVERNEPTPPMLLDAPRVDDAEANATAPTMPLKMALRFFNAQLVPAEHAFPPLAPGEIRVHVGSLSMPAWCEEVTFTGSPDSDRGHLVTFRLKGEEASRVAWARP